MSAHFDDERAQDLSLRSPDRDEAAHLAACEVCRARVEDYRNLGLSLSALRAPAPPAGFARGVLARLDSRRRDERRLALWGLLLLGPASLVSLGALWLFGRAFGDGAAFLSGTAALIRVLAALLPALAPLQAAVGLICAALCLPLFIAIHRLVPAGSAPNAVSKELAP